MADAVKYARLAGLTAVVFSGLYVVLGVLQLARGRKSLVVLKNAGATLSEPDEAKRAA